MMGAELGGRTKHHGDVQDESAESSWSVTSIILGFGPEPPCTLWLMN